MSIGRDDGALLWAREERPRWDTDKQELFAAVPPGVFDLAAEPGADLLGEWWVVRDYPGRVLGYGWNGLRLGR